MLIRRKPLICSAIFDDLFNFSILVFLIIGDLLNPHISSVSIWIIFISITIQRILKPYKYSISGINVCDFEDFLNKTVDSLPFKKWNYGTKIYIEDPEIDISYRSNSFFGDVKLNYKYRKKDAEQARKIIDSILKEIQNSDKVRFKATSSLFMVLTGVMFLGVGTLLKF